ncbi:MAG: hypothetical protein [Microviridae sp.]|nr:MAG: hypothetical protein [Microviridae sp.]
MIALLMLWFKSGLRPLVLRSSLFCLWRMKYGKIGLSYFPYFVLSALFLRTSTQPAAGVFSAVRTLFFDVSLFSAIILLMYNG